MRTSDDVDADNLRRNNFMDDIRQLPGMNAGYHSLAQFFWEWLGNLDEVKWLAGQLGKGAGMGGDGYSASLPADMMCDYSRLEGMPRWDVVVYPPSENEELCFVPLPLFVFVSSYAFLRFVEVTKADWDPLPTIDAMHRTCSRDAQNRMVPDEIKEFLGKEKFDF